MYINRSKSEFPEMKSNSNTCNVLTQKTREEIKLEFIERVYNQFSSYSRMQRSLDFAFSTAVPVLFEMKQS